MQRCLLIFALAWRARTATRKDCADWGEDCSQVQCCMRAGTQCYRKNLYYAGCLGEVCDSSKTVDGEDWSCESLGERTPGVHQKHNHSNKSHHSNTSKQSNASNRSSRSKHSEDVENNTAMDINATKDANTSSTEAASIVFLDTASAESEATSTFTSLQLPATTTGTLASNTSVTGTAISVTNTTTETNTTTPATTTSATNTPITTTDVTSIAVTTAMPSTSTNASALPVTSAPATAAINSGDCDGCTLRSRASPDVIIPFWEHELCKLGYAALSIAKHDPKKLFGKIILMWVSHKPVSKYQEAIDTVVQSLSSTHEVQVLDFSAQVNRTNASIGLAQQVLRLKVASLVSSDFYVVLEAKHVLVRDVEPYTFFTRCNQGKIFGAFMPSEIPDPYITWYQASADALGLEPPRFGGEPWPTTMGPMVVHTRTALSMLKSIEEDTSTERVCAGPLCDMIINKGATEFSLFLLFARTQPEISCHMAVEEADREKPLAFSLWHGDEAQMSQNLDTSRDVATGKVQPYMFGSQTAALEHMTSEQRKEAERYLSQIYKAAGLHNASMTSSSALAQCVTGELDSQVGPLQDGGDQMPEEASSSQEDMADMTTPPAAASADEQAASSPSSSGFCCTDSQDASDRCGTCWDGARFGPEQFCGQSAQNCHSCSGDWCGDVELLEEQVIIRRFGEGGLHRASTQASTWTMSVSLAVPVALLFSISALVIFVLRHQHFARDQLRLQPSLESEVLPLFMEDKATAECD